MTWSENMKKRLRIGAVVLTTLAMSAFFAWGAIAGADRVMGVIVREGDVKLDASDQMGDGDVVVIDEVTVPRDSWVVVHFDEDGGPGMRAGAVLVPAGTSRDVQVPIEADTDTDTDTDMADTTGGDTDMAPASEYIVTLHIDRGKRGEFEFDMDDMDHSYDKPYFVNGTEVMASLEVR